MCGVHLIKHVTKAGREENGCGAVKHEEGAESNERRWLLQRRHIEKEYGAENGHTDKYHQAEQHDEIADEIHGKR